MDDVLRRLLPIGNSSTAHLQARSGMHGKIAKPLMSWLVPKSAAATGTWGKYCPCL
jgi:hypothetical protein